MPTFNCVRINLLSESIQALHEFDIVYYFTHYFHCLRTNKYEIRNISYINHIIITKSL